MTAEQQAREIVEACRLQVRINTVEPDKAREAITAALSEKNAEIERLRARSLEHENIIDDWQVRALTAEAREAEARKVIEPFLRHYEPWMDEHRDDDCQVNVFSRHTYGELRAARAFLSTSSPEPSKDGAGGA